jgi:hypothetical protein
MRSSIRIIGGALQILGGCALAFGCVLAWMEWGGRSQGGWFSDAEFYEVARELGIGMAISAVVGVGAIALGWRLRRIKRLAGG